VRAIAQPASPRRARLVGDTETAIAIASGRNKMFVEEITLGINGSVYYGSLPIMVDQKAYNWDIQLFAGLVIGKCY
jgi:hypothetical protein